MLGPLAAGVGTTQMPKRWNLVRFLGYGNFGMSYRLKRVRNKGPPLGARWNNSFLDISNSVKGHEMDAFSKVKKLRNGFYKVILSINVRDKLKTMA